MFEVQGNSQFTGNLTATETVSAKALQAKELKLINLFSETGGVDIFGMATFAGLYIRPQNRTTPTMQFTDQKAIMPEAVVTSQLELRALTGNTTRMLTVDKDGRVGTQAIANVPYFPTLGGTGTRMVVADKDGNLSTQAVPTVVNPRTVSGSNVSYTPGNVGIGKPAGTERLEVQGNMRVMGNIQVLNGNNRTNLRLNADGTIRCRSININATWADYVFQKEYNLMPISQVKSYIEQNGKLPGVPSSKVIENEGLEVGTILKIQMEKIEEQMLYIIELKEQIDSLKAKIFNE